MNGGIKILLILFFMNISFLQASECYHYHTPTTYEIINEGGKAYWVTIVRDPNGISLVSYSKKLLPNVGEKARFVTMDDQMRYMVIADKDWYYFINNYALDEKEKMPIRAFSAKGVAHFGQRTFRIRGQWYRVTFDPYDKQNKFKKELVEGLPNEVTVISSFRNKWFLVKGNTGVFLYKEELHNSVDKYLQKIEGLDPQTVQFKERRDVNFLYDEDTFYTTDDAFNLKDHSKSFQMLNIGRNKFTEATFGSYGLWEELLDFHDGRIWFYWWQGITSINGQKVYFYPHENFVYLPQMNLVGRGTDEYFTDYKTIAWKQKAVDMSAVKDITHLKYIEDKGYYYDGINYYRMYYDPERLSVIAMDSLTKAIMQNKNYRAPYSYQHSLVPFVVRDHKIIRYQRDNSGNYTVIGQLPATSEIKDLKLCFATKDKLLIEEKVIENSCDFETMSFVGSTVDVISPCDGGQGQIPIVIEYNYFFKDKNAVYQYHTGKKKLEKLSYNPQSFTEKSLLKLLNKEK